MPVEGVRETITAFTRFERLVATDARPVVAHSIARVHADARSRCAVGTGVQRYPGNAPADVLKQLRLGPFRGHVRDQILMQMHESEPRGAVFVERRGPLSGKYGTDNVGIWLEYGTVKMAARPFMGPAAATEQPRLVNELSAAIDGAARKV